MSIQPTILVLGATGKVGNETVRQLKAIGDSRVKVAKFTSHDDIWMQQWGDIAVAAGIFTVDLLAFDGSSTQGDARYTLIWANSLILNFKN